MPENEWPYSRDTLGREIIPRPESRRLAALELASMAAGSQLSTNQIIERADAFEKYIRSGL